MLTAVYARTLNVSNFIAAVFVKVKSAIQPYANVIDVKT